MSVVEQKAKLKQKKATPNRAEKTTMAAPKCATQKEFRQSCSEKSIDVY